MYKLARIFILIKNIYIIWLYWFTGWGRHVLGGNFSNIVSFVIFSWKKWFPFFFSFRKINLILLNWKMLLQCWYMFFFFNLLRDPTVFKNVKGCGSFFITWQRGNWTISMENYKNRQNSIAAKITNEKKNN